MLDKTRKPAGSKLPDMVRIVVAIDPAVTNSANSDETGIIVAALGDDQHGYVLDDRSLRNTPMAWAQQGVAAYHAWNADRLIGEVNNGGDLVEAVVRQIDPAISYKAVRASHGKYARAEPIASLYEQGRVHHVGVFQELEDEQCNWTPDIGWSPNRMDALVWALADLMLGPSGVPAAAASPLEASTRGPMIRDASGRRLKG
jgi:phage terminase large subunit-like protein